MEYVLSSSDANGLQTFDGSCGDVVELIEVWGQKDATRTTVTADLVDRYISRDYPSTVNSSRGDTLKLFFSIRQGDYNGAMTPVPMPQLLYDKIAPFARIPCIYPDVLFRRTALTVFATPQIPQTNYVTTSGLSHASVGQDHLSFIIQSIPGAAAGLCAGASFTYHFPTRYMYVFMHCLEDGVCARFSATIEQSSLVRRTSFLIPSLLIRFNLDRRLRSLNHFHDEVYILERKLGIRLDGPEIIDVGTVDFGALSKGVNAVTSNLEYIAWACDNTNKQLAFVDAVAGKYAELALLSGINEAEFKSVEAVLLETHAYLRSWNDGMRKRADYLSKRAQALAQTVYSGIAQRDAALSHNAAVSSAQDSAVMRVIAAITIIFLPATTTATFFSTSFFDFKVGPYDRVYSWWLWLYWVVTLVLTALVLVGAMYWWKKKEVEILNKVERAQKQGFVKKDD